MSPRWIMFFVIVYVLSAVTCYTLYTGTTPDVGGTLGAGIQQESTSSNDWLSTTVATYIPGLSVATNFFSTIWKILWFDYPFLQGDLYVVLLWILRAFSFGALYGIISLIRGVAKS